MVVTYSSHYVINAILVIYSSHCDKRYVGDIFKPLQ